MTGPYYYLVASLPVFPGLGEQLGWDYTGLIQQFKDNLSGSDTDTLNQLLYYQDLKHVINQICKQKGESVPHPNLPAGTLSRISVENLFHKDGGGLPPFLENFSRDFKEKFHEISSRELEMKLTDYYYRSVEESGNSFLIAYFQFQRALNQFSMAYNIRKYEFSDLQLMNDNLYKTLTAQTSRDFGMGQQFPFLDRLSEKIENGNPRNLESFIDEVRLEYLDEIEASYFFALENVLAFIARLWIYKRWESLTGEKGRERLRGLVNRVMENINTAH